MTVKLTIEILVDEGGYLEDTKLSRKQLGEMLITGRLKGFIAISEGLQHGVPLSVYADSLQGIRCPNPMICVVSKDDRILSCPDAVAKVLALYLPESTP